MRLYVLIPHRAASFDDYRMFATFGVAEQIMFRVAKDYAKRGYEFDWCSLIAYDGIDELHPVYVYTLVAPDRLQRDKAPSPSP